MSFKLKSVVVFFKVLILCQRKLALNAIQQLAIKLHGITCKSQIRYINYANIGK